MNKIVSAPHSKNEYVPFDKLVRNRKLFNLLIILILFSLFLLLISFLLLTEHRTSAIYWIGGSVLFLLFAAGLLINDYYEQALHLVNLAIVIGTATVSYLNPDFITGYSLYMVLILLLPIVFSALYGNRTVVIYVYGAVGFIIATGIIVQSTQESEGIRYIDYVTLGFFLAACAITITTLKTQELLSRSHSKEILKSDLSTVIIATDQSIAHWEYCFPTSTITIINTNDLLPDVNLQSLQVQLDEFLAMTSEKDAHQIVTLLKAIEANSLHLFELEHSILLEDGSEKWMLHRGIPKFSPKDKKVIELRGVSVDITERKLQENSLKTEQSNYQTLFNNALAGLFQISLPDRKVSICNNQTAKIFGYQSAKELQNSAFVDYLFDGNYLTDHDLEILASQGIITNREFRFHRKDGSSFWGRLSIKTDQDGELLDGIITDVSKQKEAELALSESEKRFQDLVENSLMGISIIKHNQFVYMNPEQKRIFSPKVNISNFEQLEIYPDDHLKFQQVYNAILNDRPLTSDIEFRFYPDEQSRLKKEPKHVIIRTDLILYQGKPMTLVNMVDITATKRMESLALVKHKMASLGHVSVGIAHEIRSPLSGINLLIEAVRESTSSMEDSEDITELLDQISKASQKIEAVIKRVLDFSRSAEPQIKLDDVNSAVQAACSLAKSTLEKSSVKLTFNLDPDLPNFYIDKHLIEQVVLNLISNSVNAMSQQSNEKLISIETSRLENDVTISISDTGPGIEDQIGEKVFEPFFTTGNHGTGVGLSICQRIVTSHGGVIQMAESRSGGAQFNIRLPIEKRLIKR